MPAISRAVISEIAEGKTDDVEIDLSVLRVFFDGLYMDSRLPDPLTFSKVYLKRHAGVPTESATSLHWSAGSLMRSHSSSPGSENETHAVKSLSLPAVDTMI